MNTYSHAPILVTGADGQLSRAAVAELLRRGSTRVIAGSRTPDKLQDLAARGVELREVDFDRRDTLHAAFVGVERLAIISADNLEEPGKRLAQHRAAVEAASGSDVKHVVYTSATAPYPTATNSLINDHFWTEAALFATPFDWTILRNQLYADVLLGSAGPAAKSGKLFSATGGRGAPTSAARTAPVQWLELSLTRQVARSST
jgi:NAD(P)H dehydrogenase (quinone)